MRDDPRAPGWQQPPSRTGPVEGLNETPLWLDMLEAFVPWGCAIMGLVALIVAGLVFAVDAKAGHLAGAVIF